MFDDMRGIIKSTSRQRFESSSLRPFWFVDLHLYDRFINATSLAHFNVNDTIRRLKPRVQSCTFFVYCFIYDDYIF